MIRRQKKINFGFIFLLSFITVLFIIFFIKNNQVNQIRSTIEKQSQQFQQKNIEALILSSDDISKIQAAGKDQEKLSQIIDDITERQWQKLSSEIKPMFADETLFENQKNSLRGLIERSILSQKYVINYKYQNQNTECNWNLLGQIKVTNNVDIEFIFDKDIGFLPNGSYYNQLETCWIKIDGNWKISQSPIIFPNEFWNYYSINY